MIKKHRVRKIFDLGVPVMIGMVTVNMTTLIDTAMVGRLGAQTLAGVGLGGFATGLVAGALMGMPVGVQAITARRRGEGAQNQLARPLNGGLVLAFLVGLPLTVIFALAAPYLFPLLNNDAAVVAVAVPYFQILMINNTSFGMNFAFEGYWTGTERPKLYMRTLIIHHLLNLVFNYILIFGKFGAPALGGNGAALGTALSGICALGLNAYFGYRHARQEGFLAVKPDRALIKQLAKLAWPKGLQSIFMATGFLVFVYVVGVIGAVALAIANVLARLMSVLVLIPMGLGSAVATLVGQALGRDEPEDAERWGRETAFIGFIITSVLCLPMLIMPEPFLGLFFKEAEVIQTAVVPLRLLSFGASFISVAMVLNNALHGAGDNRRVMMIAVVLMWGVFLPGSWFVGVFLDQGLNGVYMVQLSYGLIQTAASIFLWRQGRWKTIRI